MLLGSAVLLGLSLTASTGRAQDFGSGDPFFLYYGFFLPRQAALAAQPGPEVGLQQNQMNRAAMALTDRAGLYDPIRDIGADELNSGTPFAGRSGRNRLATTAPTGLMTTHIRGTGPAGYYNRTGRYYPTMRTGRGRGAMAGGGGGGGAPMGAATTMSSFVPTPKSMMGAGMASPTR